MSCDDSEQFGTDDFSAVVIPHPAPQETAFSDAGTFLNVPLRPVSKMDPFSNSNFDDYLKTMDNRLFNRYEHAPSTYQQNPNFIHT